MIAVYLAMLETDVDRDNNWNASGEWILKVTATTSTGATKTWYGTIRVVLK